MPVSVNTPIDTKQTYQSIDYDDAGTNYRGFAKRLKAGSYELLGQSENSIAIGLGINLAGLPAGTYSLNRGHIGKNFIIKFVEVSYLQARILQQINFQDPDTNNGFSLDLPVTAGNVFSHEIVSKVFHSNLIILTLSQAIPVNEFVSVRFYGWYEDQ